MRFAFSLVVALWLGGGNVAAQAASESCPPLLQQNVKTLLDEKPVSLCDYRGQVVLVVNTASFCGFTPQYKGLEALYRRYKDQGLVVLGFPSNDFGAQEPGSAKQIKEFCDSTYNVKFPMFAKTVVSGNAASPFYKALSQKTGSAPGWNFHKYLIDRQGQQVFSYGSRTEPEDRRLVAQIETLLKAN
ncbi:MAG TPA: glutathione peroxidase [Rhodocyclaceae bacterium]|nr:glutathione peroxidase [Rhodocyclaceae bacterium]